MPLKLYDKEAILTACQAVFSLHGYKNTTTGMLAEAAGVSKALLFHHFGSKKKLYLLVLEKCLEKVIIEFGADPLSKCQDFFEAKNKLSQLKLNYAKNNPELVRIVFEAFHNTPEELRVEIDKKYGFEKMRFTKEQKLKELFDTVPLKAEVDREEAFELIEIVLGYFEKNYIAALADDSMMNENYWQKLIDKRNSFLNMIRHGIERDNNI